MFPFARSTISFAGRAVRQVAVRRLGTTSSVFHEKYGNAILASGALFCVSVWSYILTYGDIPWGWTPVGRVTPKPYKD
uniref:cytochrome c oxidase subunit 7B, mitochondrial-like n=1 Tax=Myxine glutinosa TaxID=7769 RepID=UPI00358E312F